jgi:hypothetical protein
MTDQPQWEGPNGPWNKIQTNSDYVFAIDHAVPEWLMTSIENQFYRVPMEWNHYSHPGGNPFFGRTFYNQRTGQNDQAPWGVYALLDLFKYHVLKAVDSSAEFVDLVRINLNGYPRGYAGNRHVDFDDDIRIWSLLYYVNDSDGPTRFYRAPGSDEIVNDVEAKRGRLLMFPSCYDHCAVAGTGDLRQTINFGVRINSLLSERACVGI